MAIVKHRPKIRLLIPRELAAGASHEARVVLEARRSVPIDWLRVELHGFERGTVGSGQYASTRQVELMLLRADLSTGRALPAGRSEFPFTFALPPALPPSYRGRRAEVSYTMTVRASIPWWPDARATFELNVALPPASSAPPERSVLYSSRPEGPKGREPHVEGSLVSSMIEAGGYVTGAVALGNRPYNDYREVDVALVGEQAIKLGHRRDRTDLSSYRVRLASSRWEGGDSIDYQFRLPADVTPSFSSELLAFSWRLEVRARIRWRTDVRVSLPVVVFPPAAVKKGRKAGRSYRAPPVVGSERMEQIWTAVAYECGLTYAGGALYGQAGEVQVEVRREHRGRGGIFVVGEVSYPSLGLDLEIEPVGRVRRYLDRGLSFGDEAWDRRHRVSGREAAQVAALGQALRLELSGIKQLWADDRRARIELRDAGQRPARLRELVTTTTRLAAALDRARRAIPAPAAMRAAVDRWQQLASRLGGTLQLANIAVLDGQVGGMAARVATEWSGTLAEATLLAVSPEVPVHREYQLSLTLGDGPGQADRVKAASARLPAGPARELLLRLADGAAWLALAADEVSLRLPTALEDPLPAVGRLGEMVQLCMQLRGGSGPFR